MDHLYIGSSFRRKEEKCIKKATLYEVTILLLLMLIQHCILYHFGYMLF